MHYAAVDLKRYPRLGLNLSLEAARIATRLRENGAVPGHARNNLRRGKSGGKTDLARLIGGNTHDDDVINRAGENFAREGDAANFIGRASHSPVKVQRAAIVGNVAVRIGKMDHEIAQRLIGQLTNRYGHRSVLDYLFGRIGLAGKN